MDGSQFDDFVRLFGNGSTRRSLLKALIAGVAGGVAARAGGPHPAAAQDTCPGDGESCGSADAGFEVCCRGFLCFRPQGDPEFLCHPGCFSAGSFCFHDNQCCDGLSCSNEACGGTPCADAGAACTTSDDCCGIHLTCNGDGVCEALCVPMTGACQTTDDCCGGLVCDGTGTCAWPCQTDGGACDDDDDCCDGFACGNGGACIAPDQNGGQIIENVVFEHLEEDDVTKVTIQAFGTVTLDGTTITTRPETGEDPATFAARIGAATCSETLIDTDVDRVDNGSTFETTDEIDFDQSDDAVIIGDLDDWPNIIVASGTLTVTITATTTETHHITETTTETYDVFCLSPDAEGAVVTIQKATCPTGTGGDIFEQCHDNALAGVGFSIDGVGVATNGGGIASAVVSAGSVTVREDGGVFAGYLGAYVYCKEQGSGTVLYDASADSGVVSFTVGDGDEVICDWYNITAAAKEEEEDGETEAPADGTTVLPDAGSGTQAGAAGEPWGVLAAAGGAATLLARWLRRSPESAAGDSSTSRYRQ